MENEMRITFNGQEFIANYNQKTDYYELELKAPMQIGIYEARINFKDLLKQMHEKEKKIQILAKKEIKIETDSIFMWIFDYRDFSVKKVVQVADDYEINIDDETNTTSTVKVVEETNAKSGDLVAIKRNGSIVYWGIIDNIQNENGSKVYTYTLKYILNMFDLDVPIHKNIEDDDVADGVYTIKTDVDTNKVLDVYNADKSDGANIQIWTRNDTDAQKWRITKNEDGYYTLTSLCSNKVMDLYDAQCVDQNNIRQYTSNDTAAQRWKIEHQEGVIYYIRSKVNNGFCVDVQYAQPREGNNVYIFHQNDTVAQRFYFERLDEYYIRDVGVEDFIAKVIEENFIKNKDVFLNRSYLEIRVKTHTKLNVSVSNVTDNIYNLQTWMANCTQLYNINYTFFVENGKLIVEIENKVKDKVIIDINSMPISNYEEVFETDVVSKVEVFTNTKSYTLYLLNDRTTTTDMMNENRAKGETKRVYVKDYEEAEQKALDVIQANRYNHNISFRFYKNIIQVGTPIAIKTKKSVLLDTYISAVKITKSKFVEHTCGNVRVNFIDKLLKERRG